MRASSARAAFAGLLLAVGACAPAIRTAPAAPVLATRLVLALDGVDYRDVVAARARGLFAQFREPSRLVSTFPSISDIAWHDIFGVLPPRGYQRIYYSNAQNVVNGNALDAIKPIEYEERMDLAFGTKLHHLGAYLLSGTISRREVDTAVEKFLDIHGRPTVYVYNVGPDALQHTRGDLAKYFEHLDKRLEELQAEYRRRTGHALEIAMLSDHGHNHSGDARFLPILDALEARGYHAAAKLTSSRDVAFSVDGVTTGFGVFVQPASVDSVAELLRAMDGVEIVTVRESGTRFRVMGRSEGGQYANAVIERQVRDGADWYRYTRLQGDPLRYDSVSASLAATGRTDADGYAPAEVWFAATARSHFPGALSRIARGHTLVTLNPAPVLVSLTDGYRVGLGMVSIANRMRPLGGTHGALSETNSLGVLMTNFIDTHDDLGSGARVQLGGFDDLKLPAVSASGARISTGALLGRDRLTPFHPPPTSETELERPSLELWLSDAHRKWADDAEGSAAIHMRLTQVREHDDGPEIVREEWPLAGALRSDDGRHFLLPMATLDSLRLAPLAAYQLRVSLSRARRGESGGVQEKKIVTITVRTDAAGRVAAY